MERDFHGKNAQAYHMMEFVTPAKSFMIHAPNRKLASTL
jgi:hypothetical protein